jgi:transcriptional regulator with XRE-family HTH domain
VTVTAIGRRRSPLIRRKRLASTLRHLRESKGKEWTAEHLAKQIRADHPGARVDRSKISKIETGAMLASVSLVRMMLRTLGVTDSAKITQLVEIAADAANSGWWKGYPAMGRRQQVYADLESGAQVSEWQNFTIPGLVQCEDYIRARMHLAGNLTPAEVESAVEAKLMRAQMLLKPDGSAASYSVIIDEVAVQRPSAPPKVMQVQLEHLCALAADNDKVTVRILPRRALIDGYLVPRSPFSIYHYPDGDPTAVAVDTDADDLIRTAVDDKEEDRVEVARYEERYARIEAAALSLEKTVKLLGVEAAQAAKVS